MSFIEKRKSLFCLYFPFVFLIVLTVLFSQLVTPFSISLISLAMIFVPGFALVRIFKVKFSEDTFGQVILWLALGLVFNFALCLLALLFHLRLTQLVAGNLILSLGLFVGALVTDWIYSEKSFREWKFKDILKLENLSYLLLFIFVVLVLITVGQAGANFTGDPLYHLATMRKVVENQPLSIENIAYLKNQFHPAYIFSLWHIFLAEVAQISGANIFMIWREIPLSLTILTILVWFWLLLKILPSKFTALLGTFLFIIYVFWQNGYLLTRLPVPDTLNQYLIMPLGFALAVSYIFNKNSSFKHLVVLTLTVSLMTVIHPTQYFYYLFTILFLAGIYAIFKFRDPDFKAILKRIILAGTASLLLAIPIFLVMQIKGGTLTEHWGIFQTLEPILRNDRFTKWDHFLKLSYLFLPFTLIFIRKYRRLTFVLGLFLLGPIIHNIPGVTDWLIKNLSHVFIKRWYANLGWVWVIGALLWGFVFALIDRLISRFSRLLRLGCDLALLVITVLLFWLQIRFETVENFYERVFSSENSEWLNERYLWLGGLILIVSLAVYIIQKYRPKLVEFFHFEDIKNIFVLNLLLIILVFFLSSQSQDHLRVNLTKEIKSGHFFAQEEDPTFQIINPQKFGGMETIDFIRSNIPPKSVFDTNTFASYTLPTLVDVHMASYTFDPEPTKKYQDIYSFNVPIEKKISMLKEGDIDYLIYQYQDEQESSPFEVYSQYFTKIYDSTAAIYWINKEQIQLDLKT